MSTTTPPVADATGHEDQLVPTEFPDDEFPDPDQTPADLGAGEGVGP